MTGSEWTQLSIVHLSDLHFGQPHRFQADIAPQAGRGPARGIPKLSEMLVRDVVPRLHALTGTGGATSQLEADAQPVAVRTVVALTGDLTETAAGPEFVEATNLLNALYASTAFEPRLSANDIFLVPGNHDVAYAAEDDFGRWSRYCHFYQSHNSARTRPHDGIIDPDSPTHLSRVIDQSDDGLVVAEINSAAFVQKDSPEALRGSVDLETLARLKKELAAIDLKAFRRSIRIAMIHHHPVVLPTLAEAGRGYDAIVNADRLLGLLRQFGFHVVLHGHKHSAQTFPYDSVSAWSGSGSRPMMVISGGSAGSRGLPPDAGARNTYNIINIKWHAQSAQARIQIETRGLVLEDDQKDRLLPNEWRWETLRVDDRHLKAARESGPPSGHKVARTKFTAADAARERVADETRRCFPVIDVLPSFHPEQGFEAVVWIDGQLDKAAYEAPVHVEWNAGPYFDLVEVNFSDDPSFAAQFHYYGPMLIQANMRWADGHKASAYVFAHFPGATGP